MSSIDNKCIIYEGGDSLLKPCENYQNFNWKWKLIFMSKKLIFIFFF